MKKVIKKDSEILLDIEVFLNENEVEINCLEKTEHLPNISIINEMSMTNEQLYYYKIGQRKTCDEIKKILNQDE